MRLAVATSLRAQVRSLAIFKFCTSHHRFFRLVCNLKNSPLYGNTASNVERSILTYIINCKECKELLNSLNEFSL